jgi:hypothetical protein
MNGTSPRGGAPPQATVVISRNERVRDDRQQRMRKKSRSLRESIPPEGPVVESLWASDSTGFEGRGGGPQPGDSIDFFAQNREFLWRVFPLLKGESLSCRAWWT